MELRRSARKRTITASSPTRGPDVLYEPLSKRRRVTKQPTPESTPTPSPSSSTPTPIQEDDVAQASIEVEGSDTDESNDDDEESDSENEESADGEAQDDDDDDDDDDNDKNTQPSNDERSEPEAETEQEQGDAGSSTQTFGSNHSKPADVNQQAANAPAPARQQDRTGTAIQATKSSRSNGNAPNSNANARDDTLSRKHKHASKALNPAAFQALRRVERFWDVQDIHTFLPQRLQPAIWVERVAEKLAVLAQTTGPANRDWVVHNLQHCGGIHPGVLDFVYKTAAETGRLRSTNNKEASQVPKPARLACALPTPTPQEGQPTSTGTATGTTTDPAAREAPSGPQSAQCSTPSQRQSQQSLIGNQNEGNIAPASLGTLQTPRNGTDRKSLEALAHAASTATPPHACFQTGLQMPRPQAQLQLNTSAHQYTNGRLVYQAPPGLPNGGNSSDLTGRNSHRPALETFKTVQGRIARNPISTPAASPEVGNTPTSEASSESVELREGQTGPSRTSHLGDPIARRYSPSLRHHESLSGRTQAALSLRPQLNTHYPPRLSESNNKRKQQQQQSPPSSNPVRSFKPTSSMLPRSFPRPSEKRIHQSLSPSSSQSQPHLRTQMQPQPQPPATSIPQVATGGEQTPSHRGPQEPITAIGVHSQEVPDSRSLTTPNAGTSTATTAPETPIISGVSVLKRKLDDIRQESARLREKQLQAVHFLKLEIDTAARNILTEEGQIEKLEEAVSGNSARLKQVNTDITTKEKEHAALKKTLPSLEAPSAEKRQAQSDDTAEANAAASQGEDVSIGALLFRCASDHTDEYHETFVTAWAKHLDGNTTAAKSTVIPPPCLYALFLRSVRQQIATLHRELEDLKELKAQIAIKIQADSIRSGQLAGSITELKKEKEDLMEELTKFGEEAGIQVQGL